MARDIGARQAGGRDIGARQAAGGASIVIETIGPGGSRDYLTPQDWEAATDNDLVAANEIRIGEVYDNGTSYAQVILSGAVTDASHYRILRAATGERYDPVTDTGVFFSSGINTVQINAENFSRVVGVGAEATDVSPVGTSTVFRATSGSTDNVFDSCYGRMPNITTAAEGYIFRADTRTSFWNCVAVGEAGASAGPLEGFHAASVNASLYNCVAYAIDRSGAGNGVMLTGATFDVQNCASFDSGTADYNASYGTFTDCASSDTSGSEAGLRSLVAFEQFYNASGNDFRPRFSSDLEDAGTDLSATFTLDIAGVTRSAPWEIGAYDGVVRSIMVHAFGHKIPAKIAFRPKPAKIKPPHVPTVQRFGITVVRHPRVRSAVRSALAKRSVRISNAAQQQVSIVVIRGRRVQARRVHGAPKRSAFSAPSVATRFGVPVVRHLVANARAKSSRIRRAFRAYGAPAAPGVSIVIRGRKIAARRISRAVRAIKLPSVTPAAPGVSIVIRGRKIAARRISRAVRAIKLPSVTPAQRVSLPTTRRVRQRVRARLSRAIRTAHAFTSPPAARFGKTTVRTRPHTRPKIRTLFRRPQILNVPPTPPGPPGGVVVRMLKAVGRMRRTMQARLRWKQRPEELVPASPDVIIVQTSKGIVARSGMSRATISGV